MSSPRRGSSHLSVALLDSLSVVIECLALREGPRRFKPGFTCPTLLGYRIGGTRLRLRGFHPLWRRFPAGFDSPRPIPWLRPHDPGWCPTRFRLFPVRSPLLRESRLISFPAGTEMFQFPASGGHPGIDARSAAPPGLSRPPTPTVLMTPRHPPRALRSLTTPTRPRRPTPRRRHGPATDPTRIPPDRSPPAPASPDAGYGLPSLDRIAAPREGDDAVERSTRYVDPLSPTLSRDQ